MQGELVIQYKCSCGHIEYAPVEAVVGGLPVIPDKICSACGEGTWKPAAWTHEQVDETGPEPTDQRVKRIRDRIQAHIRKDNEGSDSR